ncbi:3364_t:CDS:2 [Cetraspora pellucida]|uniref:3364_t:CDS:1 n=1 Tax=Cetraspora pellucida TaxID=1433469 RepID=A0A9N9I1D3_9GLOM|nr:3364_t:CDS:2 [Cetraspora pellucida]
MLATKLLPVAVAIITIFTINADAKSCGTNANLNIHEKPSVNSKILHVAPKGSNVDVICQIIGDTIDGKNTWNKLADGTYCLNAYVNGAAGIPRCDSPFANPLSTPTNNDKINDEGLNLLKGFEEFRPNFYSDPAGYRTIGYGHVCHADPTNCNNIHTPISPAQGEILLQNDMIPQEDCVKRLTTININSNQFSALVCFTFDLGCDAYENSSLRKKLNAGDIKGAANEFALFNIAGNKVLNGLVRRRKAERDLFCKSGGC